VKTVLLVSASETLRPKLLRALEDTSVFTAASDEEALRTLRLTEMELIIKEATPPLKNLAPFIARARHLAPTGVIVCVLTPGAANSEDESAAEGADFVLLQPFTTRHLQALLNQAEDKLRLLQEVAALRAARRPADDGAHENPVSGPPASSHASTQMAKEFAKTLAAGFDLPRVLDQFLDGVAELARPSRCAILLADPVTRHYRVAAYRALAPHEVSL
jgi:DNA-binding response OmpR family regulator